MDTCCGGCLLPGLTQVRQLTHCATFADIAAKHLLKTGNRRAAADDGVVDLYDDLPESEWPGKARRAIDGPDRHTYRLLRNQFRKQCEAAGAPCALCGGPVDYSLEHGSAWAWELDHILAVETHPELALSPANFQSSHARCNRLKGLADRGLADRPGGGGETVPDTGWPTECWVCVGECVCGFVARA